MADRTTRRGLILPLDYLARNGVRNYMVVPAQVNSTIVLVCTVSAGLAVQITSAGAGGDDRAEVPFMSMLGGVLAPAAPGQVVTLEPRDRLYVPVTGEWDIKVTAIRGTGTLRALQTPISFSNEADMAVIEMLDELVSGEGAGPLLTNSLLRQIRYNQEELLKWLKQTWDELCIKLD